MEIHGVMGSHPKTYNLILSFKTKKTRMIHYILYEANLLDFTTATTQRENLITLLNNVSLGPSYRRKKLRSIYLKVFSYRLCCGQQWNPKFKVLTWSLIFIDKELAKGESIMSIRSLISLLISAKNIKCHALVSILYLLVGCHL
jgi:hypothetical protein